MPRPGRTDLASDRIAQSCMAGSGSDGRPACLASSAKSASYRSSVMFARPLQRDSTAGFRHVGTGVLPPLTSIGRPRSKGQSLLRHPVEPAAAAPKR